MSLIKPDTSLSSGVKKKTTHVNPGQQPRHGSMSKVVENGMCADLSGFVYNCTYKHAEHFNKTTQAIATYVGQTYPNGDDMHITIETPLPFYKISRLIVIITRRMCFVDSNI